jgi:hypothetical protein
MPHFARFSTLLLLALVFPAAGRAQNGTRLLKPADVVHCQVYVSLQPVPRGKEFEIAIVAEIAEGYHIQANKVLEEYLIPATVTSEAPRGLRVIGTTYPPSTLVKFKFSDGQMAVYQGRIVVRVKLAVGADAPLGPAKIPLVLHFQACNEELCLPPAKLPMTAEVEVAKAGAAAKALHPELFHPN